MSDGIFTVCVGMGLWSNRVLRLDCKTARVMDGKMKMVKWHLENEASENESGEAGCC